MVDTSHHIIEIDDDHSECDISSISEFNSEFSEYVTMHHKIFREMNSSQEALANDSPIENFLQWITT